MSGTILIVDDIATNRILLKVKLSGACYDTLQAATGAEALRLARERAPDAILLDLALPDIDGLAVCRRLKAEAATAGIPVIVVTALPGAEARLAALRAGADDCIAKPVDETMLLARLRSLIRARELAEDLAGGAQAEAEAEDGMAEAPAPFEPAARMTVVAPRPGQALALRRTLQGRLPVTIAIASREEALAGAAPDLFLIAADPARPEEALRLMSDLLSRPDTRHAAACLALPPGAGPGLAAMALDLGAAEVLAEDMAPEEAALRLAAQLRRKRAGDRLRASVRAGLRLAVLDPLTGLHNRHHALPRLERIAARAAQTGRGYAVMLLDLDRFKAVNDTWGHAAGDAVLVEVARRLREGLRPGDLAARMGGEEFLVALPEVTAAAARAMAERLRAAVDSAAVTLPGGAGPARVTVSIGLVAIEGAAAARSTGQAALEAADRALLAAKAEGRNQVTMALTAA